MSKIEIKGIAMGLIWLLQGRSVVALTATEAAIRCPSRATLMYRRQNIPASEPVGEASTIFGERRAAPSRTERRSSTMSRGRARFTQSDLARIFKAAAKAHVDVRVKITADGTITIATGMPGAER